MKPIASAACVVIVAAFVLVGLVVSAVNDIRHERRRRGLVVLRGGKS